MRTICFEKNIPKFLLTRALRPIWQDIVFSPVSPTRVVELPDVPLPSPRWVRVQNRLSGICASDLHLLFVETDPQVAPAALPGTDCLYLGHELVGEVIETGEEVASLKSGDRVILDALSPNCLNQEVTPLCRHCLEGNLALCENASLGQGSSTVGGGWGDSFVAHESALLRIQDELSDESAVMIEPLSVGLRAALRRLPQTDERALVVGCGTIGLTVIEAVRALSPHCHITAMARYSQQVEMARKLGADELVRSDDPYQTTARITGSKLYTGAFNNRMILGGYDVLYDCVGTERTVQDCSRWARAGGAVVLVGASLKRMRLDLTPVWYQEVDLIGTSSHGMEKHDGRKRSTYDLVVDLLLQSRLTTDGFITHRFPFGQWRKAVRTALEKQSGAIKVVLDHRCDAP